MIGEAPQANLFWKEWQARRGLLFLLCGMLVIPTLLTTVNHSFEYFVVWGIPVASILLGVTLFTADEKDPARSFLYLLPISRREIIVHKLVALFSQWLLLALVVAFLLTLSDFIVERSNERSMYDEFGLWMLAWCLVGGWLGALIAGVFGLHLKSPITAVALAFVSLVILAFVIITFKAITANNEWAIKTNACLFVFQGIIVSILVMAWLIYIFTKTALLEQTPSARLALALLFAIGLIEISATLFWANWRDVVFMVVGH